MKATGKLYSGQIKLQYFVKPRPMSAATFLSCAFPCSMQIDILVIGA